MNTIEELTDYFINCNSDEQSQIVTHLQLLIDSGSKLQEVFTDLNDQQKISYPHCQSVKVVANGKNKGIQRFVCKDCGKNFSETSGKAIVHIKKRDKWVPYLRCMLEGLTLRKSAEKIGISLPTAFTWRHKVLTALEKANTNEFQGICESDDIFFLESKKGQKNLDRPARKRGGKASKAGISNEHVAVIVSCDRQGNKDMQVTKLGRICKKDIDKILREKINKVETLCTDSHRSYSAFAKSQGLEHKKILANKGQYVKDKVYHVQNVNNMAHRLRDWLKRFDEVSTKYLQNYLNWFITMKKLK